MSRSGAVLSKTLREVLRDPLTLALTLVFAPAFVLLYYLVFPEVSASYRVVVVNQDAGARGQEGRELTAGRDLGSALLAVRDRSGRAVLRVSTAATPGRALDQVRRHEAAAMLLLPSGFSGQVAALAADPAAAPAVTYTLAGDPGQQAYLVTAVLTNSAVQEYVQQATGRAGPVQPVEQQVGGTATRTDFEVYVPGLIVFAVILLVFLAAMTVAREVESGGMRRLRLTRMSASEYLAGTSAVLAAVGILAVLVTFGTAWCCGFRSAGPLWLAVLVLVLATGSVIGIGMMVAAVSRTVARAFVIANFPLGLLMLFSGSILPMPRLTWVRIAGHPLGPFELLAPTHAVTALNQILTDGGGLGQVWFELVALVLLSVLYFGCGILLLRRTVAGPVRVAK